jgi:hypothetical protein
MDIGVFIPINNKGLADLRRLAALHALLRAGQGAGAEGRGLRHGRAHPAPDGVPQAPRRRAGLT